MKRMENEQKSAFLKGNLVRGDEGQTMDRGQGLRGR